MKRRVLVGLILLNLVFIWGNSALPGSTSSEVSGGILEWLSGFLPFLATDWGHTLIRKIGHFSEFACLGLLMAALCRVETGHIPLTLPAAGLTVGCIDETIQIFTPDRASSLLDVWIDTAGFSAGIILLVLGGMLWNKIKSQPLRRNTT